MYTTMDCDFFEQSCYYTQPSPQGENGDEDLSWLTYAGRIDPTEQVGNTTNTAPKYIVPSSQCTSTPSDEPSTKPEVVSETIFNDDSNVILTIEVDPDLFESNDENSDEKLM